MNSAQLDEARRLTCFRDRLMQALYLLKTEHVDFLSFQLSALQEECLGCFSSGRFFNIPAGRIPFPERMISIQGDNFDRQFPAPSPPLQSPGGL